MSELGEPVDEIEITVPVPDVPDVPEPNTVIVETPPAPEPKNETIIVEDKRGVDEHAEMHAEHERRHNEWQEHIESEVAVIRGENASHSHEDIMERIVNIEETLKPDEPEKDETEGQQTDAPTIIEPDVPKLTKPKKHFLRRIGF